MGLFQELRNHDSNILDHILLCIIEFIHFFKVKFDFKQKLQKNPSTHVMLQDLKKRHVKDLTDMELLLLPLPYLVDSGLLSGFENTLCDISACAHESVATEREAWRSTCHKRATRPGCSNKVDTWRQSAEMKKVPSLTKGTSVTYDLPHNRSVEPHWMEEEERRKSTIDMNKIKFPCSHSCVFSWIFLFVSN